LVEKKRVYALAKELNVESKILLDICKELGFEGIKNQLSGLSTDEADAVTNRFKKGSSKPAPAPVVAAPAVLPTAPIPTKVQTLPTRRTATPKPVDEPVPAPAPAEVEAPQAPVVAAPEPPAPVAAPTPPPAAPTPVEPVAPAPPAAAPVAPAAPPTVAAQATPPAAPAPIPPRPSTLPPRPSTLPPRPSPAPRPVGDNRPRTLQGGPPPGAGGQQPPGAGPAGGAGRTGGPRIRPRPTPSFQIRTGGTPSLRQNQPAATPIAKPKEDTGIRKIAGITGDLLNKGRNVTHEQVLNQHKAQTPPAPGPGDVPPGSAEDEDRKAGAGGKDRRPGAVAGRDIRGRLRNDRARKDTSKGVQIQGNRVVATDVDDRPLRVRDRLKKRPHARQPGTQPRKGNVQVTLPITIRALSEAIGLAFDKLAKKLISLGMPFGSFTINSILDPDVAQLVATEQGCELEIRKPQDAEDDLLAKHQEVDDPDQLVARPPIVTIMGHVDHGKTSLLDKIRASNVAAGEVGGITQVIRAWQVVHDGKQITFLDTPGHEAFTKMRARGAQVTDIAVIVCAADDGVMPQTEEAINHAKAAGVSIIVAINKVDLPNANLNKTRQQLYSLGVLPDNMGGDVPFIETSAAKGTGIAELLEAILIVAELKELKANPSKHGRGTCLESHMSGDEGVQATLLVSDGTLHKGDIVICGPAFGRVRAMYNDLGNPIEVAPPGTPVRITGLDTCPDADDPFGVVDDISTAREIAEKRAAKRQDAALNRFVPRTLETLSDVKVSELKVILKADFRGSVEAIRKELEKLTHEEVRVRVLHTGIGGITASDVILAMTSPTDTMIVGFNAVPDDEARAMAEQNGIPLREYSIIYNLTDDIKAALEGKLKPRQEIVYLGRALVREVFRISKVGVVAGCHVTNGTIERSAKVRIIRGGVVVYPPADRTASLESLKRHKDDAKEVAAGYDCGIKIANYDDIKTDDVIEAYRVDEIKRTL
jgi:translation initiation factor IF-2